MNNNAENGLYFIDSNFRILYLNDTVKKMYPEIAEGQLCYNAFAGRSNVCNTCPILSKEKQTTVVNPKTRLLIHSQAAEAELPALGKCWSITYSVLPEDKGEKPDSGKDYELLEEENRLLQKQNRLLGFVTDGLPGGYHRCAASEGYPIVYASDKFLNILGYTKTELKEKYDNKFTALVHPDDIPVLKEGVDRALNGENGGEVSFHYRILGKNGYIHVVDTTHVSEFDGETFLQCVIINISDSNDTNENIESMARIRNSLRDALVIEQEYRQQLADLQYNVLDSVSCGVVAYTVPERKLLVVNNAAKRMIGCSSDENLVDSLISFMKEKIFENDRDFVLETRQMLESSGGVISQDYKAEVDGKTICVRSNIKLLGKPGGGQYILITMLDTTELRSRNEQLSNVLTMQRQMSDSLGSGIFAYKIPEHEILLMNEEAKKMFDCMGSSPDKYGLDVISRIIPEDLPAVREAARKLVNPFDHVEYVFRCDSEASGRRTFKCHTKLLSFENGQRYILSSITDITEQKLTEKRLDEERRQYRNALAYNAESLFTIDLSEDYINRAIITSDGTDLSEKLGIPLPATYNSIADRWFSQDRISSESEDINYVKSREKLIERYKSGTSLLDIEYRLNDGTMYYHIMVLLYEIDEHIKASFVVYNITNDKQEEKIRRTVIDSLSQLYSSLFYYSFTNGRFAVYKAAGDLAAEMSGGVTYEEFCRLYLEHYVDPEYRELIAGRLDPENLKKLLHNRKSIITEYKRKGAGWYRAAVIAAERDEHGNVTAIVFSGYTIEQQKQAELAQQDALKAAYEAANLANSAKTSFLAAMSHDIRTPMNIIIGMNSIARTHINDKERVSDCLSKIDVSSKHLLGLINEVLDMSKIESGKVELQEEEFNLSDLVDNLLTMSMPGAAQKNHELSVLARDIEHEEVIGDSMRIQQVFMNLMSNAVKYTPDGGKINLFITEKPMSKESTFGCYEFVFEDNGIGMSEEFLSHVFEPFSRATDDTRVSMLQGTGLGMPIAQNIVRMMNGDIKVESKLNEGSKFTVTIFLKLKNENKITVDDDLLGKSVLVIDTDADTGAHTCKLLTETGMKSELVTSVEAAAEKIRGGGYFAVIADYKLKGGTIGPEAICELRRSAGNASVSIVVAAYDWSEIELEARAAGANAFISDPIFKSRLVHMLNSLSGEEENTVPDGGNETLAGVSFGSKRVLLVEDVEINAEIAAEILRAAGLEVEFASNGKEAVDIMSAAADNYYDIVLMDIQMPIMNGYEAARAIRALSRDYTKSVPIIAMTANAFAEDIAAAKSVGMNEHIAKPFEPKQLMRVLKKWLA